MKKLFSSPLLVKISYDHWDNQPMHSDLIFTWLPFSSSVNRAIMKSNKKFVKISSVPTIKTSHVTVTVSINRFGRHQSLQLVCPELLIKEKWRGMSSSSFYKSVEYTKISHQLKSVLLSIWSQFWSSNLTWRSCLPCLPWY
jgi:hypothetical protein